MATAVEIRTGAELDRAVAEAIGVDPRPHDPWLQPYSMDLNVAFAAAFSAGLFGEATLGPFVLRPGKRRSFVVRETLGGEDEALFAYGDTPALAICAAILKLKESE